MIGNERTIKILENFSKQVMGEDGKRECRTEILQKTCPGGFSCSKRSEGFPNLSVFQCNAVIFKCGSGDGSHQNCL